MSNKDILKYAKVGAKDNMTYKLIGADGKAKKIWQNNKFGQAVMSKIRESVSNPIATVIGEKGEVVSSYVKDGILNKISAYGLRVPFLLGNYVTEMRGSNLITNTGMAGVASRINGSGSEPAFTYIAIGTGTTGALVTDTTLETEITTGGGQRASATASRTTTDVTNDTARLVLTYNFTASFAVTEAGALNAVSVGVLLNRQVFSAVNVVNGDALQVTIDIDVD